MSKKKEKHFKDCPINNGYAICTCSMMGEEAVLVSWAILKQEGKLKWYNIIKNLTVCSAPPVPRLKKGK